MVSSLPSYSGAAATLSVEHCQEKLQGLELGCVGELPLRAIAELSIGSCVTQAPKANGKKDCC